MSEPTREQRHWAIRIALIIGLLCGLYIGFAATTAYFLLMVKP